jgi:ComF family protein
MDDCDLIVPIPLFINRLRRRGFNQAVILAREFFPYRKGDIRADLLRRVRDTGAQTSLSGVARRNNLGSAFQLRDGRGVTGKRICLVDDVYTTGTTVNECAKILQEGSAEDVRVLTLARVIMRN